MGTSMTLLSGNLDHCPRSSTPPGGCWCQCYCFSYLQDFVVVFVIVSEKSDPSRWDTGSDGYLQDFAPNKRFDSSRWGGGSDGHLYDFAKKQMMPIIPPIDNLSHFVRRAQKQFAGSNFEEDYVKSNSAKFMLL